MSVRAEDYKATAFRIIKERSFKRGNFQLASGRTSDFYLDMKPSMMNPEGIWAISNLLCDRLRGTGVQCVGGLAMGAVPLVSGVALVSHLRAQPLPAFFVRQEVKNHGTKKKIEGLLDNGFAEVAGKPVAILDDVTTTGQSAMIAVTTAREAGAHVRMVVSVVDRLEGARDYYRQQDIDFVSIFTRDDFMRG